jgi:hypothetical protein
MSDVIYLSKVRLSFPHLIEPQKHVNEVTGAVRISYNADFLLTPDNPSFKQFMEKVHALAVAKWEGHASTVLQMIQNDRRQRCYGAGEEKVNKKSFEPYDGYVGHVFITASLERQPQMIQENGQPVDPTNTMAYQQIARKMYGGCYVNAAVKPWPQVNKHGNGVRCDLIAVQFAEDGKAFGEGAVDVSGMFGASAPAASAPAAMPAGMPGLPSFLGGQ